MGTIEEEAALERERIIEDEAAWIRSLGRCRCPRIVLDRAYLGRWSCRLCGKLTVVRAPSISIGMWGVDG